MIPRASALMAVLAACQPAALGPLHPTCLSRAPAPGTVVVRASVCSAERPGDGLDVDYLLANRALRVVIRDPGAALSLPMAGGGTLVDAAPWGLADVVEEIAPIVGGGWLDVDVFQLLPDGLLVEGTVVDLPDGPADAFGASRSVTWRIAPDVPQVDVEGAEGLWIHAVAGVELLDGKLVGSEVTLSHDATEVVDLGGAIRAIGATRLIVTPTGWSQLDGLSVSGSTQTGQRIEVLRGATRIDWLPVADGRFEGRIDPSADGLRAWADGHSPGPSRTPGEALVLEPGPTGAITVTPTFSDETTPPFRVHWFASDGRSGQATGVAGEARIEEGDGTFQLTVDGGPTLLPTGPLDVQVPADSEVTVPLDVQRVVDPGTWVLAELGGHSGRSWSWRDTDAEALRVALGQGRGFVVLAADGDIPQGASMQGLPAAFGARILDDAGGPLLSWPWTGEARRANRGLPPRAPTPDEALASTGGRMAVVTLGWLDRAGAPWSNRSEPRLVLVPALDDDPAAALAAWWTWLDAAVPVSPVGPLTWVDLEREGPYAAVDVEAGLLEGRTVATTGPLLGVEVDGVAAASGPSPEAEAEAEVAVRVWARCGAVRLDTVVLLGEGGRELARSPLVCDSDQVIRVRSPGRYLVAAAWSDAAWALTAPRWLTKP